MLGLIFGGIMTLICIVFAIISLANSKAKNAIGWAIGFVISLSIVLFSIFQFVHRVSEKVKDGIDWAKQQQTINNTTDEQTRKDERQEWLDTLQANNMLKFEDHVPADFYVNRPAVKDTNGIITVPFIYPFSIRYNQVTYTGDLIMEGSDSVFVQNITQVAFDQNFAIMKIDNTQSESALKAGHTETEYLLFDLRTRNFEPAANNEKLLDLGRRIGYTGNTQMHYLSDAYRGWIEYVDYD
jgi:hypothetical protein